jgi:NADH dehydrogenase
MDTNTPQHPPPSQPQPPPPPPQPIPSLKEKVIIVGGGFGGINAAKRLKKGDFDILLIDKSNHHLFQPLLYQVATAALSPGNIAMPIREILRDQENTTVIMGEVERIDKKNKQIHLKHGDSYTYDYLILAPGARHSYFGHDEWEAYAPGLKSLSDAVDIREHLLLSFEKAEISHSPEEIKKLLRFVVIGGGPTGVEMAGSIAEIALKTLFKNFRNIKPEHSEIILIEGGKRVLQSYPEDLSKIAKKDLEAYGIKVLTDSIVTNITKQGVYIGDTFIPTANVIWAAGNQASAMLKMLETPVDRSGRVIVDTDLSVPGNPEIFVIGDAALKFNSKNEPLPGIAPVAIQEGVYVANILLKKTKFEDRLPFIYHDKGTMATIGKAKAVAVIGKLKFSGLLAWLTWCFIHIFYLISFPNRLIVMTQWFFWYISGARHARLIKKSIYEDDKK